MSKKGFLE